MNEKHNTADLVSKALRRAWQLGQTYWQQADSEYPSQWKKADVTQATFDQLVADTKAALTSNSGAQPAPSVPREAIEKMPTQLMDIAVSNGANSVSMPDEYVEVAAWLCGIPAQPTPSVPECPYPCGWQNLLKYALVDGSFLERSINEGEPVTENGRAVTMLMVLRLRDVLMAINNAAPETKT